jgi:hypothetical protein
MARTRKREKAPVKKTKTFAIFEEEDRDEQNPEEGLPKDEAGRRRVKRQYEDLLGIRIKKLKGRILNRERINKTSEGVYFICIECERVCHNLDEGLIEDPENRQNACMQCRKDKEKGKGKQAAA